MPDQQRTPLPRTSQPAAQALAAIEVEFLEDLTKLSEKEIADLHGMGPKALGILKEAMKERELRFAKETLING